jgi:hypothetical protein
MDTAIWAIIYDLPINDSDEYLNWFHEVHIPEKLARPGYEWAGHYRTLSPDGHPASSQGVECERGDAGYIALFGGSDTSVFLNPSPAQLKPRQPELTRSMMARRIASRSFIATVEWRFEAQTCDKRRAHAAIELACCDVAPNDEDFGAWCVQELKPGMNVEGFQSGCKLLTVCGPAKHATLAEFSSFEGCLAYRRRQTGSEWAARVDGYRSDLPGTPLAAERVWPAL